MSVAAYTAYKEFLILIRDKGGLAVILLMPVALVFIVTLIQDSAWKATDATGIEILLVNQDDGFLGRGVVKALTEARFAGIRTEMNGRELTEAQARRAVLSGEYSFALIVPEGASKTVMKRADEAVTFLLNPESRPDFPSMPRGPNPAQLQVLLAPEIKGPLKKTFLTTMGLTVRNLETHIVLNALLERIEAVVTPRGVGPTGLLTGDEPSSDESADPVVLPADALFSLEVARSSRDDGRVIPTSVQHNVPAWTMFGMFFILIPMSGSIIRERNDGTLARLMTMPVSQGHIIFGRVLLYMIVCLLQFGIILLIGLYILPLFGLSALEVGRNFPAVFSVAVAAALAAVSFGFLTGNLFQAPEKAAMFGSISIVVLSAVGGIMVPVVLMPRTLQAVSHFSPLGWGIDAFSELFVNGGGFGDIWPNLLLLTAFALGCLTAARVLEKRGVLYR